MKTQKPIHRRDFLKLAGLAGISLPAVSVVGKIGRDEIVSSPDQYGGFLVRRLAKDDPPYQVDDTIYKRFDEAYQMFSRANWDEGYRARIGPFMSRPAENIQERVPGLTRLDYAFYTASWTSYATQNLFSWEPLGGFGARTGLKQMPPWDYAAEGFDDAKLAQVVKLVAKFYGASLVGITEVNERWLYDRVGAVPGENRKLLFTDAEKPVKSPEGGDIVIPRDYKYAIVIALEMDADAIDYGYLGIDSAATGHAYSRMAEVSGRLAEFIRDLGYGAIPMGNDTALSVPLAIDAGLGEMSRMGLLITPKFGPRVRIAKVFTNLQLATDTPIRFGAQEFCVACKKCAHACPSGSITDGPMTWKGEQINNNDGVLKWYSNLEECHAFWQSNGVDCTNCISVCPFNKPTGWLHDVTRGLIGATSDTINSLLVNLDDAGYGSGTEPHDPNVFWSSKKEFMHKTG